MALNKSAEVREEDYAACMQAIANIMLTAVERGLGTHMRTGAVMDDPAARAAVGVRDGERILAVVSVGVPAEMPAPKARQGAAAVTQWVE
jgi:nitroreductase